MRRKGDKLHRGDGLAGICVAISYKKNRSNDAQGAESVVSPCLASYV